MKFEINDWGYYEIDFYNDVPDKIKIKISKSLDLTFDCIDDCYILKDNNWAKRHSGMIYGIKHLDYYPIIKDFLDKELNLFLRKEKLKKINNN